MSKPFPEAISLKREKCPECGDSLRNPELRQEGKVIQAVCAKDGCGFSLDLFWLCDIEQRRN